MTYENRRNTLKKPGEILSRYAYGNFVEISRPNIYLSLYRGFLEISQQRESLGRVPLDDILGLVITGHGCSHSSNVLVAFADRGVPVSICGSNFMPKALILPLVGNCKQKTRIQSQVEASKPLKKRLWKQVVQLKLRNQAYVLKENGRPYEALLDMSKHVKSGDPGNLEAQGARRYWASLFPKGFKRDKNGEGVNAMLNYAYAIIRSCVARGVVTTGLHPSLGIHHHNVYNPMCLVDDLMEPFRPLGDHVVRQLFSEGYLEVNREVKNTLSKIAVVNIESQSGVSPLFQVISRFVASLSMTLSGEQKKWKADWKINWDNLELDALNSEKVSNAG